MLRRKPSRVEKRADVSDEYEHYLREKERRQSQQQQQEQQQKKQKSGAAAASMSAGMSAEQHAAELARQRRVDKRARLGLPPTG